MRTNIWSLARAAATILILAGSANAQPSAPAAIDPDLLAIRERVWRAWFAGDEKFLSDILPADFIGMSPGDPKMVSRAETIAESKAFAAGGGKLARISFSDNRSQRFGDVVMIYCRYEMVLENKGERVTQSGRVTEVFVRRHGRWIHPAWHLDGE
jgi:hypothetical protein